MQQGTEQTMMLYMNAVLLMTDLHRHLHVDFGMGLIAIYFKVCGLEVVDIFDITSPDELRE